MSNARVRLPPALEDLLRSELVICIQEANLGDADEEIAQLYLLRHVPQVDIAAKFGWTRPTVASHVEYIVAKVEHTARRLCLVDTN